jgi:TolA-binding protein
MTFIARTARAGEPAVSTFQFPRTDMRLPLFAAFAALAASTLTPAAAQRRAPTPEDRIERLEKQLRQVQRQVFPKGQPADTAGFNDDPAATLTQTNQLSNRLDALEQQLAELIRASEENGNRLSTIEADLARLRTDQDRRLRTLESGAASTDSVAADPAAEGPGEQEDTPPPPSRPKVETARQPATAAAKPTDSNFEASGEEAYDRGYQLWTARRYDEAIAALRAMASSFPGHRRVSWANNLAGRALLDKGQPRAAAEALLANYRSDPRGERAQDSLFYLGQALVRLGQAAQACKAYSELEEVYGSTIRSQIAQLMPSAKIEAKCR